MYYPAKSSTKPPILFFIYGGGLVSGSRRFPPPLDLCYTSVGAFFAKQGFLTIIPDYRLVPEVTFPKPAEDIRDAILYAIKNLGDDGDVSRVFVMGHSAGALHISTLLLLSGEKGSSLLEGTGILEVLKGVVLNGGAYHFNRELSAAPDTLNSYYAPSPAITYSSHQPFSLLQAAPPSVTQALPPILLIRGEKEMAGISGPGDDFAKLLSEKTGKEFETKIFKGHNHISFHFALGSGEGEEWGHEVAEWLKTHI